MTTQEWMQPIIETAQRNHVVSPEDYVENGLLHCGKCHTPKECFVPIPGTQETRKYPSVCRCDDERLKAEKAERRDSERAHFIKQLSIQRLQDATASSRTFACDDGQDPELMAKLQRYVKNWAEFRQRNTGLLLWGGVGTGKTFAADCVANALREQGVPVLITSLARFVDASRLHHQGEESFGELIEQMRHFPLVVLDDLGAERDSSYALEQVYAVVDARYRQRLPLIISTNIPLPELQNPDNLGRARIYDRILEGCIPVQVCGESRRKQLAAENLRAAEKLLLG